MRRCSYQQANQKKKTSFWHIYSCAHWFDYWLLVNQIFNSIVVISQQKNDMKSADLQQTQFSCTTFSHYCDWNSVKMGNTSTRPHTAIYLSAASSHPMLFSVSHLYYYFFVYKFLQFCQYSRCSVPGCWCVSTCPLSGKSSPDPTRSALLSPGATLLGWQEQGVIIKHVFVRFLFWYQLNVFHYGSLLVWCRPVKNLVLNNN